MAGGGAYDRIGHAGRSTYLAVRQGKLPSAKAFKLAERDKTMSEEKQKSSFMQELDRWSDSNIISPLYAGESSPDDWMEAVERVKKAIREKVLQSYRNGQAAGPRQPVKQREKVFQR